MSQQIPSEVASSTNDQVPDAVEQELQSPSDTSSDPLANIPLYLGEVNEERRAHLHWLLYGRNREARRKKSPSKTMFPRQDNLDALYEKNFITQEFARPYEITPEFSPRPEDIEALWTAICRHVRLWWEDDAKEDDKALQDSLSLLKQKRHEMIIHDSIVTGAGIEHENYQYLFPEQVMRKSIKAIALKLKEIALRKAEGSAEQDTNTAQTVDLADREPLIKADRDYNSLLVACRTDIIAFLDTLKGMKIVPQGVIPVTVMKDIWYLLFNDLPREHTKDVWLHLHQPTMDQQMVWDEASYCINELAGILVRKYHPTRYMEGMMQKFQNFQEKIFLRNDKLGIESEFMGLPVEALQQIIAAHREENRDLMNSLIHALRHHCFIFGVGVSWVYALDYPPDDVSPSVKAEEWDDTL